MRKIDSITKRLDAIGAACGDWAAVEIGWQIPADSAASVLTNMPSDDPNVVELQWPDAKPADDGQKIRWLKQYSREQLEEIRAEWQASPGKRAKAALAELARLEPLLELERPPKE